MAAGKQDRIFPRWLIALAGTALVGILLYVLRGALTPVFLAFLIAYMLDPVVDRFEARGYPRAVGIGVMLTVVLGAVTLFLALAVPGIVADIAAFFHELPETIESGRAKLAPILAEYGIDMPDSLSGVMEQMGVDSKQLAEAVPPATAAIASILGGTFSMFGAAVGAIMVPVFAAYLLHDFDRITAGAGALVPAKWRPHVVDIAKEVDTVLGEFVRGQFIVMMILAILYALAYSLLGVRLAVLIAVVAGLLSFIPYVGGAVALGLAVIMCLLDWGGWWQLGGVVVAYSVIQVVEGFVITPRVVGEKVGLPAIAVLFALMVGGELFGFMGVLLALPAAAVVKIFLARGLAWYRETDFFRGTAAPTEGQALSKLLHPEGLPADKTAAERKRKATEDEEG
jgi:predicted PurR-regulated permease PerM